MPGKAGKEDSMASLNGVSLEKVRMTKDHEGARIASEELYIDGEMSGKWAQDSWGGPDDFSSDKALALVRERARQFAECFPSGTEKEELTKSIAGSVGVFMGNLLKLLTDEKEYRKLARKGYPNVTVHCEGRQVSYTGYRDADDARKAIEEEGGELYGNPEAFDIIVDATHPAPARLMPSF